MNKNIFAMCALCMLGLGLSACSKEPQQANPPANDNTPQEMAPAETAKNGDDLIREPAPQVEAPAPQPTLAEIPMSKGTLGLQSVKVIGKILTVKVIAQPNPAPNGNTEFMSTSINLEQTNYIDDDTAKKVGLLQDDAGIWMAAPLNATNKAIQKASYEPILLTFKFPAPPESTKTISINLGNAGSFDGIPVER
ncbi:MULTISPECIES: hypothetical protein [Acinetobacter]|jgi:hypothetical protein|uniref:hypothetical protein n=1 Tax=Acinetobacter TaxID=469 RepID=UPI001443EECE|nr:MULTISPECIES: hypothetical protein [Acinetobacter]